MLISSLLSNNTTRLMANITPINTPMLTLVLTIPFDEVTILNTLRNAIGIDQNLARSSIRLITE